MNNEYESGRYGTHLKYFQSLDDYNDYVDSSTTVKVRPNVSFCDGNIKYVKYNWQQDTVVLSATTNPTAYKILTAANIEPSSSDGFTIDDLASITLNDIYCEDGGSGGFDDGRGYAEIEDPEEYGYTGFCERAASIFYAYGKGEWMDNDLEEWEFPEFQYFTGITSLPMSFFDNCLALTKIIIPPSVTSIGAYAFHDCWFLTDITILNSQNNVRIVDDTYDYNPNTGYYNTDYESAAFAYTGYYGRETGMCEHEAYIQDYDSPLERVIGEGILKFQPQS